MNDWNSLIADVKNWFYLRHLDSAIVGFSGGVDSATTAALLHAAGIKVKLVLALTPGQKRESNFDAFEFASLYPGMDAVDMGFEMPWLDKGFGEFAVPDEGKEAALPILRNACFYAVAAMVRTEGFSPVVVGTANFDEAAYLGFWGKASDGAQDFYPISHLFKSEVRELARYLKVPEEIIKAIPSGDLLWSGELNDHKMIGATYPQIEEVAKFAFRNPMTLEMIEFIQKNTDEPEKFMLNIVKNQHKYGLTFPGYHLKPVLEHFRKNFYGTIAYAAATYLKTHNKQ